MSFQKKLSSWELGDGFAQVSPVPMHQQMEFERYL